MAALEAAAKLANSGQNEQPGQKAESEKKINVEAEPGDEIDKVQEVVDA